MGAIEHRRRCFLPVDCTLITAYAFGTRDSEAIVEHQYLNPRLLAFVDELHGFFISLCSAPASMVNTEI